MPISELIRTTFYRFLTAFYKIKNIFLAARSPLFRGALDPGLVGLYLKMALVSCIFKLNIIGILFLVYCALFCYLHAVAT